jgi:hypothetical protein
VVHCSIIEIVLIGVDENFIVMYGNDHEILNLIFGDEYITEILDSDRVQNDTMYLQLESEML